MATKQFEITSYEVHIFGQTLVTYVGQALPINALVQAKGKNGETFDILITPDWNNLPPYSEITAARVVGKIVAAPERYAWFVDLLRNEGPVTALVDNSQPMFNRLSAGSLS